jgi:hypothetical protein
VTRPIAARGDLTGERGLVALGGENPTGQRYLLAQRSGGISAGCLRWQELPRCSDLKVTS